MTARRLDDVRLEIAEISRFQLPDAFTGQFSIVTPTFNSELTLARTLESVSVARDVLGEEVEHIVIDGGSTDSTLDIVNDFERKGSVSRWLSAPDRGIYHAMNRGLALASGSIVGIINSDDVLLPGALKAVAVAASLGPTADVYHGNLQWYVDGVGTKPAPSRPSLNFSSDSMPVNHPATFVRRAAYERYGLFDEGFRLCADRDLMLRLNESGVEFHHVDEVLVRMQAGGASANFGRVQEEIRAIMKSRNCRASERIRFEILSLFRGAKHRLSSSSRKEIMLLRKLYRKASW